ncbi:prepilin-type N-terminal cleavage/methylation domain-containing protein [Roseomonas sp. SSH11]|uniref:Type II secretion system protein J n=1 Tax=Pararoseomonas baculiformis TaxID=2820812 RepID=A0ABS4AC11_9PROT|nr:type II secretion system protein GspJ [Pararoseomonas baculiformis]MBP0444546.1 prepilin-type N-terminal cleavage/methylation domain-containing protein [Pararoseomonas baculiformis]
MTRRGMSLVEVLVGLVLLGMVATLGFSSLHLVGQASQVTAADLAVTGAVQDLLRLRLAGVLPLVASGTAGRPAILFEGQPERMAFVAELPRRFGLAGPAVVELRAQEEGLRLFWRPLSGDAAGEGQAGRVLMDRIAGLRLRYFGSPRPADAAVWRESWSDASALPGAIEVSVQFHEQDARRWPPFVVVPRLAGRTGGAAE